jgi:hypothetical protein
MTLLDAQQFDEARVRRRRKWILTAAVVLLFLAWVVYHLRHYPERAQVDKFFSALQKQDYESAYGIWFHDPYWKQHPPKYSKDYPYSEFYRDWGPGGEWGLIKAHSVDCSLGPSGGSGVIVQVTVNHRTEHAYVWVQTSDQTLSFSPTEIECGNGLSWMIE